MATKKPATDTKSKAAPKKAEATRKAEKALVLTQEDLLRVRLFDANIRLARQEVALASATKASILAKIDPEGTVLAEEVRIGRAKAVETSAVAEYQAALSAAAKRLGLENFEGYGIDPVTGILTKS